MADKSTDAGMVGPFWVVEADGRAAIIGLAVPLERADAYGDMLTLDIGHLDYWSGLARRGTRALRLPPEIVATAISTNFATRPSFIPIPD